jgi:L-ectoine synthase
MKVIKTSDLPASRKVEFHAGISNRILLDTDGMGYTLTKTVIQPGERKFQHYKHHLEACYCVSGFAELVNAATMERHLITPDTTYVLDQHDPHFFEAFEETVLICVFNPPLTGREVHQSDGSYAPPDAINLHGSHFGFSGF